MTNVDKVQKLTKKEICKYGNMPIYAESSAIHQTAAKRVDKFAGKST